MRSVSTILGMLTVAPITTAATLVCYAPQQWGGSFNPLNIIVMAVFGLFTVPLWVTYIPAVAVTPLLMSRVSSRESFLRAPLWLVLLISLLLGAPLGLCVISPVILLSIQDPAAVIGWALAGVVSGAATLAVVSCIHRCVPPLAQPGAAPNDGPATQLGNSGVTERPPSVS